MKQKLIILAVLLLFAALISGFLFCVPRITPKESSSAVILERVFPYKPGEKFSYEVTFNKLKAGTIDFEYVVRKDNLDLVVITTDINVLNLFQINSKESIYIDVHDSLPRRVEREVLFFGKKEHIIEEYNQKDGWVNVIQEKDGKVKNKLLPQKVPIHNSHSLFFVYPLSLENKLGETFNYNLPLEKVKIKVKELRKVATAGGIKEFYVLEVNPKRIVLEVDREKRIPLRLVMPALWSKLIITKK